MTKKLNDQSLDQQLEQLQTALEEKEEAHRRVLADYQNFVKRALD
jgi:molecular chaperone GrpE (heat shock protein)